MQLQVTSTDEGHRLRCADGDGAAGDVELVNQFLRHLFVRCFSPATVRAYAYDELPAVLVGPSGESDRCGADRLI